MLRECVVKLKVSDVVREIKDVIGVNLEDESICIAEFISGGSNVILTYTGSYSSPATYMTLLLRSLTKVNANFFSPKELTYYVVPYDEGREARILIYSSIDGLSELNILMDQLRLTGHEFIVITPTALPNILSCKIPKERIIVLNLEGKDRYWPLLAHIVSGLAIARLMNMKGVRVSRVWNELSNLVPIIDSLVSYYEGVIEDIVDFLSQPLLITSTPTMMAVAEYLAYSRDIRVKRFLVNAEGVRNFVRFINRLLIIETDVEEYSMKEIKGLALTAASEIKELKFKTDPLTAPIYGLIIARIIEYLYSRKVGRIE